LDLSQDLEDGIGFEEVGSDDDGPSKSYRRIAERSVGEDCAVNRLDRLFAHATMRQTYSVKGCSISASGTSSRLAPGEARLRSAGQKVKACPVPARGYPALHQMNNF
jgi:hypothetical protein